MIQWKCHECGAAMEADEADAGQTTRCGKCGATNDVPPEPLPAEAVRLSGVLTSEVRPMPLCYILGGGLLMLLGIVGLLYDFGQEIPLTILIAAGAIVLALGGIARRLEGRK